MKTLEERVAALEKSNRRWRYALLVVCAAGVGIAAAKPISTSDLVRTRRLEIVDGTGTVMAEFDNERGGIAGGQISVRAADGKPSISIWAAGPGGGMLSIFGEKGETQTQLNAGSLLLYDDHAYTPVPRRKLNMDEMLAKKKQHLRVELGELETGGGVVRVYNPLGKIVAEMQCSKTNQGLIMAKDVDGNSKESLSGAQ